MWHHLTLIVTYYILHLNLRNADLRWSEKRQSTTDCPHKKKQKKNKKLKIKIKTPEKDFHDYP